MFTCRDGKAGVLSSQATKMLYSPCSAVNIKTNQIVGNSLFDSEVILIINNIADTRDQ